MLTWLTMRWRNLGVCAVCCASLGCTQVLDFDSVSTSVGQGGGGGSSNLGSSCASRNPKPALCHDFDADPLGAFGIVVDGTNGSATKDTALFVTPPASFLAASKGGNTRTRIVLEKAFPDFKDAKVSMTIDFDVYIEEMDKAAGARITPLVLLMGPLTDTNQVALQFVSNADTVAVRLV